MEFNDLLTGHGIDTDGVMLLRHRPTEPELRKVLPWLATENHDVYNNYQRFQGPIVEKAMLRAKYVASFLAHGPGKALFVGLYQVKGHKSLTYDQFWKVPAILELKKFGMRGMSPEQQSAIHFDLRCIDFRTDWKGKLVVQWPGKELSWWRWAANNKLSIHAIYQDSELGRAMPDWHDLILNWNELQILPRKWEIALAQWRCVYFIVDGADGKGYIGSAYGNASGDENLLGRWRNYAKSGHGGNKLLRLRQPDQFQFSILQRVSPDMEVDELLALEASWKNRLHTREFGLNDN